MSLFDDPEWGSSQVFTYYPSSENEVSFSTDNIQQNFKKKRKSSKNHESSKKMKLSDKGKSDKCNIAKDKEQKLHNSNTTDKIVPPDKTAKGLDKTLNQRASTKKKKKHGDINKKPQNEINMSKQNSGSPAEKLVTAAEHDKTQSLPVKKRKKKKVSNKRNKYKELHIEQMKRKGSMLANGLTGETPKSMKNDVGPLESEPSKESAPCGNGSRDQSKEKTISPSASQTLDICKMETTGVKVVSEKKPKKSGKNNKMSKKIKPETDSVASLNSLDKLGSVEVNDIHEIDINSTKVNDRSSADKTGKKKKKKHHSEAQTLDSASVIQKSTGKTSQNSDACEREKGKKSKKKATAENDNIGNKKKTNKDTQHKGMSKQCKEEVSLNNKKKKKKDKNKGDISENQEVEEREFEAKEFEGIDADSDLEHDLDTYLQKLNFGRFLHNSGDGNDDILSSEEMEIHSDEDWESDSSIGDEESAEEHTKGNDSSKVANTTKHENKKIKKVSAKADENNSSIVIQAEDELNHQANPGKGKKFDVSVLSEMLKEKDNKTEADPKSESKPAVNAAQALRQKMMEQLNAARFRFVNEQMYSSTSKDAQKMFKSDPKSFDSYHKGFQSQVAQWPINPLDLIIKWLKNKPKKWVVADFGCGEAVLAEKVSQETVHSFDLAAANSRVTVCDMAHTPLPSDSVDVVVFCLSLMGTNIKDFILEANRVLHEGGIMKIAEVESRFSDVNYFINHVKKFGFHCTYKDTTMKYFYIFDFKKHRSLKNKKDFPDIILKPCKYKKR